MRSYGIYKFSSASEGNRIALTVTKKIAVYSEAGALWAVQRNELSYWAASAKKWKKLDTAKNRTKIKKI